MNSTEYHTNVTVSEALTANDLYADESGWIVLGKGRIHFSFLTRLETENPGSALRVIERLIEAEANNVEGDR